MEPIEIRMNNEDAMNLTEKEKPFFELFDLAPIPWQSLDSNGCILEVNEAWLKTFGYQRQAILGKPFTAFLTTESREKFNNAFPFFKSTGIFSSELVLLHKNGQKRAISINGTIEKNRDGSFKRIHCILKDITESQQTLKKYEEHNRKFEFLSHSASEMLELKNLSSIYNYICANIQKQFPGSIVLIVSVDEEKKDTCLMDVEGLENRLLQKGASIAGFDPLGKKYKLLPGHQKIWKSGNLYEFKGGLAEFASTEFPTLAAKAIQKVLDIHKIYTIGINKEGNLLSAVHIITRHQEEITDNKFIESFVKQAGIVIQRKMLEEELHYHSMILNQINDVVTVTDLKGRITYVNQAVEKFINRSPGEILGKSVQYYEKNQKKGPSPWEVIDATLKSGKWRGEISRKDFAEKEAFFDLRAQLIKDQQNKPIGISRIATDITEKKRALEKMARSEANARAFLESTSDILILIDKNYRIIDSNEAHARRFGLTREALIGQALDDFLPPADAQRRKAWIKQVITTGKTLNCEDYRNGDWYDCTISPVLNGKGLTDRVAIFSKDITDRKKAEEKLRKSEARYRDIMSNISDAVFTTDKDLKIDYISPSCEKIFAEPPKSFRGQSLIKKFPGDGAKKMKQLLEGTPEKERAAPGQKDRAKLVETTFSRWDGRFIHLSINVSILRNETGEVTGLLGIVRDVTKQKLSEMALKQSAEQWDKTFRSMHTGITLLDTNQQIIQSNQAFQKIVGKKEEELREKPCCRMVHGTEYPVKECPFPKMLKSKKVETVEMNIGGRDYKVTVDPILDEQGKVTGAVHSMLEVTQQKREKQIKRLIYETAKTSIISTKLENLLEFIRQELSKLIDTTNFYVALYTPEEDKLRKIIFLNEKDDFVEWKASESLAGKVIQSGEILLLNDKEAIRKASLNRTILGGIPAKCWLGVPLTVDRKPVGVMVLKSNSNPNAYTLEDARLVEMIAHELSAFIGRKRMMKDLMKAKKEAEKSDKLKSAFLANMSHEIRTPMNGILGFIELLNEPHLEEKNKKQYIDILKKSSRRLINTINDIIEISKIDVGEWVINPSEVNIREILHYLMQFFMPQALEKGIELKITEHLPESHALVRTDRSKLEGILTNLIGNALKFTDKGSIELGNYVEEKSLVFYVKDTGKGIPADKLDAVFERFTQADPDLTRGHEGSGLGLSIVKASVEKLGGNIWVESEMGKGSTFFFTIPYQPVIQPERRYYPEGPESEAVAEEKAVVFEKKGTVLLAEDNPVSALLLKTILKKQHFDVIEATSGEDAVRVLHDNPGIDMVLMDIKMPGMNGLEATREIRKFNPAIPIIAQTAHALENDKEKALEAGCNDYISKPIRWEVLKKIMQKYL